MKLSEITKWICLLRGINVGNHNKILMSELRSLFVEIGFPDAATYIQSGNVVFSAEETRSGQELSLMIAHAIRKKFKLELAVITLKSAEVKELLEKNPFLDKPDIDPVRMHVILFQSVPDAMQLHSINPALYAPDQFYLHQNAVFLLCVNGYGQTKLNNQFFEKKTGKPATARNLRTMEKLMMMALDG